MPENTGQARADQAQPPPFLNPSPADIRLLYERATFIRTSLFNKGYEAVPVVWCDKGPRLNKWQDLVFDPARPWPAMLAGKLHLNTGVKAGNLWVFDVDITDEQDADEARYLLEKHLGETAAVRFRQGTAKLALVYRAAPDHPRNRRAVQVRGPEGTKIEVIAQRNSQLVVEGVHPDSIKLGKPLRWTWEELPIWETDWRDLPLATPEGVFEAVRGVVEALPPPQGAEAAMKGAQTSYVDAKRNLASGVDLHSSVVSLAGYMAQGDRPLYDAVQLCSALMQAIPPELRDQRWHDRHNDIERCVKDIYRKEFAKPHRQNLHPMTREWLLTGRWVVSAADEAAFRESQGWP